MIPLVYGELSRIASRNFWQHRLDHALQSGTLTYMVHPTVLHEKPSQSKNKADFFGVAAQLMQKDAHK